MALNGTLSPQEWARTLGGKVMPNGRTVRYPRPDAKPTDQSLTLTVGAEFPGGYIVADTLNRISWQEQKDDATKRAHIPAKSSAAIALRAAPSSRKPTPAGEAPSGEAAAAVSPFHILDADEALRTSVPDLVWHIPELMPGNNVSMLGGNGGEGKSLLALQLAHQTRCGLPFLGRSVRPGAVIFYSAEESEDELAWRLQRIAHSVIIGGEPENPLKLISMADQSALLATRGGPNGEMVPTPALTAIEELAHDLEAVLIVIDAAADVFPGEEINRGQTRDFIRLLRGVAIRRQCAVLLLAHPSVSGMNDGRGYSGNTAWNNSVRSRLYLTTPKGSGDEDVDPCLRQLELMKINNAARGLKALLRFDRGAFHQEQGSASEGMSLEQQAKASSVFLELVQKANDRGQRLSDSPSVSYAPKKLEHEAKQRGVTKSQLVWALEEGLARGRLAMSQDRDDGKDKRRLVVVPGSAAP